jgi:hypothetical protein
VSKKRILFFARDYQVDLFGKLSELLDADCFYFTMLKSEQLALKNKYNIQTEYCFENFLEASKKNANPKIKEYELDSSFVSDRYWGSFNTEKRNQLLNLEITFISEILDATKPNLVINEIVAVEIAEVLYLESRRRDIEYAAWMVSPFRERCFFWLETPMHGELEKCFSKPVLDQYDLDFADNFINSYIEAQNLKPFYASNLPSRYNLYNVYINISKAINYYSSFLKFKAQRKHFALKNYFCGDNSIFNIFFASLWRNLFIKYDTIEGLSEALVFYPLHYEPEASILYMSEFYEDQAALLRNLSKCISRNQVLVVKEHPQQAGILLTKKFQNLKNGISNLIFLPAEFSTKYLLKKSELIITQTSTAGFEALIIGKPVFVLGKVFYNNFRNINRVESFEKLRLQIRKKSYLIPNPKELKEDLATFVHVTQVGNIYFNSHIYDPQNLLNIAKAIMTKLEVITNKS